jgi:hypothetical protein
LSIFSPARVAAGEVAVVLDVFYFANGRPSPVLVRGHLSGAH